MNDFKWSNRKISLFTILILLFLSSHTSINWGFYAHKRINRLAVFTMPPDVIRFYKKHIVYLTENAINPDERRYADPNEAPRHYIDLDIYGDSALHVVPHQWRNAVEKYTQDTLQAYGIVPWHINLMKYQLTQAFQTHDLEHILRLSADIGHYIGDSNVPLHTTENYNGQLTGQYGIHGFWESRLPELYANDYDFFVGKAEYISNVQEYVWEAVTRAHHAMDTVLLFERQLSNKFDEGKKYSFEERGSSTVKVYSKKFSKSYHDMLNGMVERQFRISIKMVGDIWYTSWVDAGQPDIDQLLSMDLNEEQKKNLKARKEAWKNRTVKSREHN